MSAVVRTRRSKNKGKHLPLSTTALWLVMGLAIVFFAVRYGQELLLAHDLNDKAAIQRVANAALRDENSRLKATLQYYQSDKYIEQRAREDLNLRRSDEEVLIPISVTPVAGAEGAGKVQSGTPPISPLATPSPEKPNWQKWLDLFGSP